MKICVIGGHLGPALAVIEELQKKADIVFIGRKHTFEGDKAESLEYKTITSLNIPFISVTTGRLQRKFTKRTIPSLLKLPYGTAQAILVLKKQKPDIILGFGGYLSIPYCFAAKLLSIPVVIHEQTFEAGAANRICSRFAAKICLSWKSSLPFFPKDKCIVTGNPLRSAILNPKNTLKLPFKRKLPILLITGGSAGSHIINHLILESLNVLLKSYNIIHQTGDAKEFNDYQKLFEASQNLSEDLKNSYHLVKFINPDEIGSYYLVADMVICRSGINTISELLYFGKKAILIPLWFAQKQEQTKNAHFLSSFLNVIIIDQKNATSKILIDSLKELKSKQPANNDASRQLELNAAKSISEVVYSLVN